MLDTERRDGGDPLLTAAEEHSLALQCRSGDRQARALLITSNLRFVKVIARQYRGYRMSLEDLIQEGNAGLVRAADMFDPARGVRFTSYAVWWIRAQINKYLIDNWALVRLGTTGSRRKLFFALARTCRKLPPAVQEEAAARQASIARMLGVRPTEVAEMEVRLGARETSFDSPYREDSPTSLGERMSCDAPSVEEHVAHAEEYAQRRRWLAGALRRLTTRERIVARHRLLRDEAQPLALLSDRLGLSRERVRQIEIEIRRKLRSSRPVTTPVRCA